MTRDHLIAIEVVFYCTAAGAEPVRDWLRGMPAADRRTIGTDLATVQFGWPVGMPLCRPLGGGLWEVRSNLPRGRIARTIFCIEKEQLILLHGFIKKTQKTPPGEIDLALKRKREGV